MQIVKTIETLYQTWVEKAVEDADIVYELHSMVDNKAQIEECFYQDMTFGTGGLRGIIGAGTNRMNLYTVAKASQGIAVYIKKHFMESQWIVAISYDSRIKSHMFAEVAAGVFAANGINVQIYQQLMPTPCLSYAVRELACAAGIMITASHNPANYNGYKVYNANGCQITLDEAVLIQEEINRLDIFNDIHRISFAQGVKRGQIKYITDKVEDSYILQVKKASQFSNNIIIKKDFPIIYTPLNGTGLKPVLRCLKELGFTNINVVKEQEQPDGSFSTCPNPNPEIKETMALGLEYAKKYQAELLLATDPDCDRVGIAVRSMSGEMVLLSGNETGMLLLDYICSRRSICGTMPVDPVFIKTIVTTDMAERIAENYGVRSINVLTGFKFIGEQIDILEKLKKADSFVLGFEESYGYLSGSYVRDKDAVNGTVLICEMFAYYKTLGIGLHEKLLSLYSTYGYAKNTMHSYTFPGINGEKKIQKIMDKFRQSVMELSGKKVIAFLDYNKGIDHLPKSNVIKFILEDYCSLIIRPSGTEPKIKIYISVCSECEELADRVEKMLVKAVEEKMV